ncbi:M56 family metallopeptidase [Flavobacterium sp. ACN6]|uniref:M56 family metallopeptidase n=1 Tax=Flavobacterium sp. ACN6 TaxID=1920426 RepID=UPI000BB2E323|nr:M56 family metallopeptidase [Flavobacterium sp. ACN6]PBJ15632.1 BlaR1 peptidase M56 [Flavobacterium sp. ACN6]
MEALYIYIAKSCSLMLFFYCVYYFLLRKETFFNSNRWFLLSGLIVAAFLPLLSYTKIIWIDADPYVNTAIQSTFGENSEKGSVDFSWSTILLTIYGLGFLVFILKLAIDFYSLNAIIKGKKIQQQADFKFIDINENIAPFSYFEYIIYNSSLYTPSELENILEHEKVHSDQNHTVDVLISRIFCILFWFNPIIWLYKKAIMQNLEFIADSEAAKKIQDKKSYQYTLLKITTHENCVAITNHFYQSLIKKRIVMLNKNQSKKKNSWKYYTVIPALAAFVLLFQVEVIAKEKPQIIQENESNIKSVDVYKIRKNSTDAELNEIKSNLLKDHNVKFEISEIKRNDSNQLTSIVVDIKKGKQRAKSIQNSSNQAINEFGVVIITYNNGDKKIGIQTINDSNKESKAAVSKGGATVNVNKDNDDNSTSPHSNIIITQNQNSKNQTNVNVNSNTSTKTNSNTNSNSSTIVTTDNDDNNVVTKITTSNGKTNVAVTSGSSKSKVQGVPLIIVDGTEMPHGFDLDEIKPEDIKSMSVFKGTNALSKYGEKGSDGVIEIETRK